MEKWEYKSIKFQTEGSLGGILDTDYFDSEINIMGRQGWELVSCISTHAAYGKSREVIAVFKRRSLD